LFNDTIYSQSSPILIRHGGKFAALITLANNSFTN
jgi:hypothetical protein